MEEVKTLGYQDKPPYQRLRSILQAGFTRLKCKDDGRLDFPAASVVPPAPVQVPSHTDTEPCSRFSSVQPILAPSSSAASYTPLTGLTSQHGFLHYLLVNLLLISCFQRTSKRKKASTAAEESETAERPKRRRVAKKTGTRETREAPPPDKHKSLFFLSGQFAAGAVMLMDDMDASS